MGKPYDFSGWATKANLLCSDGRVIRKDAFKDDDGKTVPLVWNHQHNDPENILGHALLKNTGDGVYAYCTFNDSEKGKTAKLLVEHGDVRSFHFRQWFGAEGRRCNARSYSRGEPRSRWSESCGIH